MNMDAIATIDAYWQPVLAVGLMLVGLLFTWRGLVGGPSGGYGLLRRRNGMYGRLLGWRVFLYGLTLTGIGAAWLLDAKWLLVLSLGFGFVEMQEATGVIKAWRWDGGAAAKAERRPQRRVVRIG
jgi:hypothetical protein